MGRLIDSVIASLQRHVEVEVFPVMLATAARRNADAIAHGRIDLRRGDGTTLPLPDDSLDAVLGVHTIYFWPDPRATLVDAARALRPGGRLVLAMQPGEHPLAARFDRTIYHPPTTIEATDWLYAAGFIDVGVEWRPEIASTVVWLTATAT